MRDKQNFSSNAASGKAWKDLFGERVLNFSISVIRLTYLFPNGPASIVISTQVIKSSTSIGANFWEAQDASSPKDFTQKLSISLREAKETIYWLKVIKSLNFVSIKEVDKLISEAEEIAAILVSGVKKSKQKQLKKEI